MRIHFLQHVPFEGLGYIEHWLQNHSHTISCTALYRNSSFPRQSDFDALIVMGGPMGVYDTVQFPWILDEKKFIEQTLKANKPVIGICLGAQMIADVLGASVFPGQYREIGWFPIQQLDNSSLFHSIWPENFYAFHWHGDTFDLPEGAVPIGSSEACVNQGFVYRQNVFAFQFHLESNAQSIELLIKNCGHELEEAGSFIQKAAIIRNLSGYIEDCNHYMDEFLKYVFTTDLEV